MARKKLSGEPHELHPTTYAKTNSFQSKTPLLERSVPRPSNRACRRSDNRRCDSKDAPSRRCEFGRRGLARELVAPITEFA